jgi:hypothetical protein
MSLCCGQDLLSHQLLFHKVVGDSALAPLSPGEQCIPLLMTLINSLQSYHCTFTSPWSQQPCRSAAGDIVRTLGSLWSFMGGKSFFGQGIAELNHLGRSLWGQRHSSLACTLMSLLLWLVTWFWVGQGGGYLSFNMELERTNWRWKIRCMSMHTKARSGACAGQFLIQVRCWQSPHGFFSCTLLAKISN